MVFMHHRFYISSSRLRFVLLTCLCCIASLVYAQRHPFYNLNVENGLIQSQVTGLTQDKFGHLWIGTLGGLSRYDGKNFTNYTVRDNMATNEVNSLAADKNGNIWIGSTKGVSQFDGREFKHYVFETPENPNANFTQDIVVSDDGLVWCRALGKVYTILNGKSKPVTVPGGDGGIISMMPDGKDLWAARRNGVVYHYHNKQWDSISFNEPQLTNAPYVSVIFKDRKNRIWLGTNAGLYKIDSNRINVAKTRSAALYNLPTIVSIAEDNNGAIWCGTVNGAIQVKDSSVVYYNKHNGLTDNTINCVLTDAEGNVWLASDGQGIFRFSGTQFTILDEGMGLPSAQVMSIAASGGRLYLGTYDAGLYIYEGGQVSSVQLPLKNAPTITAMKFRNNELWMGTRGAGLWRHNGSIYKAYTYPTILHNSISCMYKDAANRLWVGFPNGAMLYANDSFHKLPFKDASVQDFCMIGVDSMLMATTAAKFPLKLYTDDEVLDFNTNGPADSSSPQCMIMRGRQLWIGTSDNGVICYDMVTHKSFVINKSNGLHSDFIYNIILDNANNIWVGTGYGIHKITMTDNVPKVTFYGKGQGVQGMESNHNAVLKMADGSIWFGTTNGAMHYTAQSRMIKAMPVTVALQSIKVFGETIGDTTYYDSTDAMYRVPYDLHLPYRKNNITFTFQAISLSGVDQVKYRYRINGLDAPWSDWSSVNTITYSALPPGKYTLLVECMTGEGNEISELKYPFEIITPFHKTGWFRLLVLAACILLGITIQYIANRRKQNRLALTERLRREEQGKVRERTAEDFHDEVGNKLTRINVLTNVLKNKIGPLTPDTQRIIEQIQDNTGQLYSGTKDILWSLKPSNDSLYEVLYRIRDFGAELYQDTDIDFIFTGDDEKWRFYKLPLDVSRNLIMIFKEALNNSLKYSGADRIKLDISMRTADVLHMELSDNGKGFDYDTVKKGHGIDNMNVRAKRINGRLYFDTHEGKGTHISLSFRLTPNTRL